MTSSPDTLPTRTTLPPALSSMWRLCKLGYQHEPGLMLVGVRAVAARRRCPTRCSRSGSSCSATACSTATGASCASRRSALGVSATATWFLRTVSTRVQRRFRDKVTIALESHVARLQASIATIAHQERPDYLDRLVGAAQPGVRARPHVHVAVLDVRLDPAARRDDRAARVDPSGAGAARAVRAADRADVDLAARRRARRPRARRAAQPAARVICSTLATTAPPGKEVRVTGIGDRLVIANDARPGSAGIARSPPRAGARPPGTRSRGPCSAAHTSAPSSSCRRDSAHRPATCCWCWLRARGCRRMSARPSAKSASCAASGWTAPGVWRGSRTTPRRWSRLPIEPVPARLTRGHPLRARLVRLSRHRPPRARRCDPRSAGRARSSPSSARTARARPRS